MAATKRDYYDLLGLQRTAGEAEIKRAFRQKARELHPDVSAAPDAEERFREVVEAYEVLSKPETRQLYDRFGHSGLRSGGFEPSQFDFGSLTDIFSAFFGDDLFGVGTRGARARGRDVAAEVEIELADAAAGVKREVPFEIVVDCAHCGGSGAEPGTPTPTCPTCAGRGRVRQVSRSVFGEFVRTQACPQCGGYGRLIEQPCGHCDGARRVAEPRSIEIEIPPGIHDGQQIRLSGDAELEFPPGTQPGEIRVLRGAGMPVLQGFGRGDQRVLVNVNVPRNLSPEQREALEEFERHAGEHNYRPDESFFEKLKSAFR
jgi:molecular chaperone DnaJ